MATHRRARQRVRPGPPRLPGAVRRPAAVLRQGAGLGAARDQALPARDHQHPRRGHLRRRRPDPDRRHRRRDRVPRVLRRHRGRHPGLRLAEPDRRRQVQRLHLGLLQHPRGRAAGLLDRARRDRRLRLHRPARRDADLGGDRRARGDGHPVAAVPGDHPDDRRLHRGDPAVRRGAVRVVPLAAADHHLHLRPVAGHLRPLLPAVPAADRHALVVLQAAVPRGRGHPDPLLLRLHRLGRPGRRRHGRGPGDPHQHRHDRGRRLLPQLRDLGLDHHRPDHGAGDGDAGQHPPRQPAGAPPAAGGGRRRS